MGAVISVPINLWYQKKYVAQIEALGHHEPEMRLPQSQVGGILTMLSFFLLVSLRSRFLPLSHMHGANQLWITKGWTGYKSSIPWFARLLLISPRHETYFGGLT